jgi:hypothetical protein
MFRSQQRKTKILFGLSDVFLTAAAFQLAYLCRQWLPLNHQFYLLPDVRTLLLVFSVATWVATGYWLNVYGKLHAAVIGVILRDSFRQVGCSALALGLFIFLSWFLLAGFRIAARNLIPVVSRRFGVKRYILVVGLGARADRLARNLEQYYGQGVRIVGFLAPPSPQHVNSSLALERLGGTPLLTFTAAPDDAVLLFARRRIDIALAAALIVILSPLLLVVALLVKLTSAGPVVFRQTRCGLNGRTFTCYKFRSMVADAERRTPKSRTSPRDKSPPGFATTRWALDARILLMTIPQVLSGRGAS